MLGSRDCKTWPCGEVFCSSKAETVTSRRGACCLRAVPFSGCLEGQHPSRVGCCCFDPYPFAACSQSECWTIACCEATSLQLLLVLAKALLLCSPACVNVRLASREAPSAGLYPFLGTMHVASANKIRWRLPAGQQCVYTCLNTLPPLSS